MNIYQLQPGSHNYNDNDDNLYLEEDIIIWAEDVANMLYNDNPDITTLLDRDNIDNIDIYQALDILDEAGEYLVATQ